MVSTTRGTISRAVAEKAEGKKPMAEGSSKGAKSSTAVVMKSRDYKEIFSKMSFVGTRYPDPTTMTQLGLADDCELLFYNMQLRLLMSNPQPAYERETVEFLSTLRVDFYEPDEVVPEQNGSGRFIFRINKQKYRMSFRDLEGIFAFEPRNGRTVEPGTPISELHAFWEVIGMDEYKASAKSTQIRNPALRYVHKALAHTIYARRDVTNVSERELFLLNEGMVKIFRTLPDGTEMVGDRSDNSMASYLLKSLLSYQDYAQALNRVGKASSGQLSCGGIITPILLHAGIELKNPIDPLFMDIKYLRKTTYLRGQPVKGRHNYQFAYRQFDYELGSFFLPNPELTGITTRENVDFDPPIESMMEQGDDEPEEIGPVAADSEGESSGDDELPDEYRTGGFHFGDHEIKGRKSASNSAFESINTLKSWNIFQDKTIKSLLKTVKKMGKRIKELTKAKRPSAQPKSTTEPEEQPEEQPAKTPEKTPERTHAVPTTSADVDAGTSQFHTAEASSRKRKASKSPSVSSKEETSSNEEQSLGDDTTSSPSSTF